MSSKEQEEEDWGDTGYAAEQPKLRCDWCGRNNHDISTCKFAKAMQDRQDARPTTARVWTIKESTRDIGAACVAATRLARPTVNEYLEALREAENPDNCIEDEYNPKHNKVRAKPSTLCRRS